MSGDNTMVNTLLGLYLKMVAEQTNWIMSGGEQQDKYKQ